MAEVKLRAFLPPQFQFAQLGWSFRGWWPQTCPPCDTRNLRVTDFTWVMCTRAPFLQKPNNHILFSRKLQMRGERYQRHWHSSTECQRRGSLVAFLHAMIWNLAIHAERLPGAVVLTEGKTPLEGGCPRLANTGAF